MSFQIANSSYTAGSQINPATFVTISSGNFTVSASVSGDSPIGVSQMDAEGNSSSVSYAALTGDTIGVYGDGQECWLTLGATVTVPAYLKPDNNGNGIPATSGNAIGAVALQSGASGERIRVKVLVKVLD